MKKLMVTLLAAMLVLVFTACLNEQKSPYETYMEASQNFAAADSYESELLMDITMKAQGVSMDMEMKYTIKQVKTDEDMDIEMQLGISVLGMAIDTTTYYTNGVAYVDTMGEKSAIDMSTEEMLGQMNYDPQFSEDAIKEATMEKTDDGTIIHFILDKDVMNSLLDSLMENVMGDLVGSEDVNYGLSDVEMAIMLDDSSALKSIELDFQMEMDVSGQAVGCDMNIVTNVLQVGGVSIDFPDDLGSYSKAGSAA